MTYKTKDETKVEITVTANKHYTVKINDEVKMDGKGSIRKPRNQAVTWHGTRCVNYLIIDGMHLPLSTGTTALLENEIEKAKEAALTPVERIQREITIRANKIARLRKDQTADSYNWHVGEIDEIKAEIAELESKLETKTKTIGWTETVWADEPIEVTKTKTIVTSITLRQ